MLHREAIRYQRVYRLTPATLAPYAALTYPSLAPGSAALQAVQGELWGISAAAGGALVALVIAERRGAPAAAVLSLMVHPAWRRRGIATRLLQHLMAFLAEEGLTEISIRYQAPYEQLSPLDRLLIRLGWAAPQQHFLLLAGPPEPLAALTWPERFHLPAGTRLVAWQPSYRPAAERLGAPAELQAALRSSLIEPAVSLALLAQQELVGWLLVDRTSINAVRYSSLFVAPGHRARGQALRLIVEGCRRQVSAGIPLARAAVAPQSEAMLRLVHRHLAPLVSQLSAARFSRVELPNTSRGGH